MMTETESSQAGEGEPQSDNDDRPVARFIHDHPGMAIAGGIALGVLAAALLPKRNREYIAGKSSAIADAVSAAGLMLYREAVERAEAAGDDMRGLAERLGDAAMRNLASSDRHAKSGDVNSGEDLRLPDQLASLIRFLRGRLRD